MEIKLITLAYGDNLIVAAEPKRERRIENIIVVDPFSYALIIYLG